jgi:hypothetical protein
MFCGSKEGHATEEHVIPKWARNALGAQPVTLHMSDGPGPERREVLKMPHLNIILREAICARCNNEWLAGIENDVRPYLSRMMVDAERTTLAPEQQAALALWAVKTTWLYELAARQKHGRGRTIEGYRASDVELAWLRTNREPPPRALVWLGCWDCEKSVPVNYEPSQAPLPTADGSELNGHLTTISLGYVVFQVFTVDFLIADLKKAPGWNQRPPAPLDDALIRIWPPPPTPRVTSWPPPAFPKTGWRRLITWDERLRSGQ